MLFVPNARCRALRAAAALAALFGVHAFAGRVPGRLFGMPWGAVRFPEFPWAAIGCSHRGLPPLRASLGGGPRSKALTTNRAAAVPSVAGLQRRIAACNRGAALAQSIRPLLVGDSAMPADPGLAPGLVLPEAAAQLARFPDVFDVTDDAVRIVDSDGSVEARSRAVATALEQLRQDGAVPMLKGWRDEPWPVKASFDSPVELVIERAAGPLLGVRGFGCHVNGLVSLGGNQLGAGAWGLWVARRSRSKPTYPGKLDHVVAGGLSHGELPCANVIKECEEEASVPESLARQASPAGIVEYCDIDETGWGVKRDCVFCYDLELPAQFKPAANDGEVESFELWDMPRVIENLASDNDDWKPNVALVIIDMLVRRGLVAPEQPGYIELVRSLRS